MLDSTALVTCITLLVQFVGIRGKQYQMNRMCGRTIKLNEGNSYIAIIHYESEPWRNQKKCLLNVESKFGLVRSVRFQFYNVTLYPFGCVGVEQTDGRVVMNTINIKDFPPYTCDNGIEPHVDHLLDPALGTDHVTRPHYGLIATYRNNGEPSRNHSFTLVVNAITTGERCNFLEHTCNNKRCIPKALKCHPYNPCGDNSDCTASMEEEERFEDESSLPWFTVVGIVVGCIVGLVVLAKCCCGQYNKMDTENVEETADPFSYDFEEQYDSENSSDIDSESSYSDRRHTRSRRYCESIPLQKIAHAIPLDVSIRECSDSTSSRHPLPLTIEIQTAALPLSENGPLHESTSVPVAMETYTDPDPPPSYDEVMSNTYMYKTA